MEILTESLPPTSSVVNSNVISLSGPNAKDSVVPSKESFDSFIPALEISENLDKIESPMSRLTLVESTTHTEEGEATWTQRYC